MTKNSLLKWLRKSYSIAEIGVDGITYTCPKNGLYNLVIQTDKGQRIKKLCDENDLSFAADTVYSSYINYDSLKEIRHILSDEFIVSPIQWTPFEFSDGRVMSDAFSFGINPLVDKRCIAISDNIDEDDINKEQQGAYTFYYTDDLSESGLSKLISMRHILIEYDIIPERITIQLNKNDDYKSLIYAFSTYRPEHLKFMEVGVDRYKKNISPQEFIREVLKKHKLDNWTISEMKLVVAGINRWNSVSSCVTDIQTRCAASYPLIVNDFRGERRIVFSYDDERYDSLYKNFSFFDIVEES